MSVFVCLSWFLYEIATPIKNWNWMRSMGMVLSSKFDPLVRSCCKIERTVVVIFIACKEYRIRGIKMSNRRFKHTPQFSELRHLNIIQRSIISKWYFLRLILDSLFACGIKNTLYNVLIFDMDTFNPHPSPCHQVQSYWSL